MAHPYGICAGRGDVQTSFACVALGVYAVSERPGSDAPHPLEVGDDEDVNDNDDDNDND